MDNRNRQTPSRCLPVVTLLIFFILAMFPLGAGAAPPVPAPGKAPAEDPYKNAEITRKVIPSVNDTFGYDILVSGRPVIHQPSIPGLPGNEGFKTKEYARKVADLVVKKLRNNEMPPTVSVEEMKKLGVRK